MNTWPQLASPPDAMRPDGQLVHRDFPQSVRTTIHIDSRDRDFVVFPSSSHFTIELPELLKNVSAAVLVSAEVPLSYYVFTQARGNTQMTVRVDAQTETVQIPDGNYSVSTMVTALEAALDEAFGTNDGFSVDFSSTTLKCSITSINGGQLDVVTTGASKPTDWGLAYYLGFPPNATTTGVGGVVTGTRVSTLNPENYVLVDIEELNGIPQCALYAAGSSGRKSFAKIPLTGDSYQYTLYDKTLTFVHNRPHLAKVDKLRVSLRFHDGTLVDLNGAEWSMTLEFACTLARSL